MITNDAVDVIRRNVLLVGVVALAGLVAAIGIVLLQRSLLPRHQATASLFVSMRSAIDVRQGVPGAEDPNAQASPAHAVATLARSSFVLQPVIERLRLPITAAKLADRVSATAAVSTAVATVTVTGSSAAEALEVDDAVTQQLVATVGDLLPADSRDDVRVTLVRRAHVTQPEALSVPLWLVGGLLVGLALGLILAALRAPRREPGWDRLARH